MRVAPARNRRATISIDLLLMAVAASWGSTYWVTKGLVDDGAVLGMLSVRMLATAGLLGLVILLMRRAITRTSAGLGTVYGLILAVVFTLETFGIAETSATNAGLIISMTIVFTPIVEAAIAKSRPSPTYLIGGLVAMIGIILLSMNGHFTAPALGDWLVLGAAVARAFHVTIVKRTSTGRPVDDLSLTFVQMATCAVVFTALAIVVDGSPLYYLSSMTTADIVAMTYMVIICTLFPFFIQMWAVRRTSASRVSLLLGTEPIYAALIGVTLAGDELKLIGWIGLAVVLISVSTVQLLTTVRRSPAAVPATRQESSPSPARENRVRTTGKR